MNLIEKVKAHKTLDLLAKANEITIKEHGNRITLERAIFLSWCDKGTVPFVTCPPRNPDHQTR